MTENSDPKNVTNPCLCLGLLQELFILFTIRRDNVVYIGRICGGRERESEETVGRITKIIHCIPIVFGLPYNYKVNLIYH